MKNWTKSRTIALAIAQAILGVLMIITKEYPEIDLAGVVLIVKSIADILLRLDTSSPIAGFEPVEKSNDFME